MQKPEASAINVSALVSVPGRTTRIAPTNPKTTAESFWRSSRSRSAIAASKVAAIGAIK